MHRGLFNKFLASKDTLQVYEANKLVFASNRDRLLPLVDYIDRFASNHLNVVIFDKIMGRAAALLCAKANCQEVYSPLGSRLAVKALDKYGIRYHLSEIVPYIQKPNREEMCPMEKLSIGKAPEEFYELLRNLLSQPQAMSG